MEDEKRKSIATPTSRRHGSVQRDITGVGIWFRDRLGWLGMGVGYERVATE